MESNDSTLPYRHRRPARKIALHLLRRGHLYAGLLMLPWVLMYGITAILFNHPTWFSDQPAVSFDEADLAGTPMGQVASPAELAALVVAELQKRAPTGTSYVLLDREQAKYAREFAFATVKADGTEVSLLFNVSGSGGSIRSKEIKPPEVVERAPFAIGRGTASRGGRSANRKSNEESRGNARVADSLVLPEPIHQRIRSTVPQLLERKGFPAGEVTITSVPDLAFAMDVNGVVWRVLYNELTGTVSGKLQEEAKPSEISTRRFLQRLHLAHGYPGEPNVRTAWAVIVDIMACIMLFWGLSGLFMWWQIKATRKLGAVVLLFSLSAAVWVGISMHSMMTGG